VEMSWNVACGFDLASKISR